MSNNNFIQLLNGCFTGILHWPDLDVLCNQFFENDQPWYIYQLDSGVPDYPLHGISLYAEFGDIIKQMCAKYRRKHCGFVYVDNIKSPSLIKIYDPFNMGTSCCGHTRKTLPRWIISRCMPLVVFSKNQSP